MATTGRAGQPRTSGCRRCRPVARPGPRPALSPPGPSPILRRVLYSDPSRAPRAFIKEHPMARLTGEDFFDVDSLLTESERQTRDLVRGWVDERYLPLIEEAYEEARFPAEVIPEVAEMGLLGATLPEKYGCAGVKPTAYGLTRMELER